MRAQYLSGLVPNTSAALQGPLAVSSAAITLLSLISGNAWHGQTNAVLLSVETDQIRICPDGTVPSATKGFLVNPGERAWLTRAEADMAKVIRVTGDAALQVSEYKTP